MDGSEGVALSGAERGRNLMKAARWKKVIDLFQSALACAPDERAAFLDETCHGDEGMRREVESLLTSHERAENFIEVPAFEVAPELATTDSGGPLVGKLIGHYRIESLIGIGGMGEVYLARDEGLGRKAALKLLPDSLTRDEMQLSRFKNEARTASALNHPNILTVYEIGAEGNVQFIATEFIEGVTLRVALAAGKMSAHKALEIAVQVASALAAAHDAGVVHRDIKPENIMLRPDGYAKVLDFGIAKLTERRLASDDRSIETTALLQTRPGLVLGTAHYMSPEQARGQKVDARSDIWSLGVVLYEMVAGSPPFRGETPSDCIASILTKEPPPLSGILQDFPLKLESILQKALRKKSDERYQTISEILADLRILKGELEAERSLTQTKARAESIVSKIKRHKHGVLVTLVAALLAGVAVAWFFFFFVPAALTNEKSIAVLPFENLSEDKSNAYFADGIQDEILTRLSKIADLKVISRTSTEKYKSKPDNLREIAKQLGVSNILEGSVQKAADQVRVSVQLINATTDGHLWAEIYDRKLTDIFKVETDIAKTIAETLQAKLTGSEEHAISVKPTADAAAYQSYLKGRFFWGRRSGDNIPKAIEYFEEAIRQDPNYALAYAGLAEAWITLPGHASARLQDVKPKAKEAALKSLQIDDTLAGAHTALAQVLFFDLDFAGAIKEFQRAIDLDPNYATAHHWYANGPLLALGRFDEAVAEGARAVELDPLSPIINVNQANNFIIAGRYHEAIHQIRKALELDPEFGYAHSNLGMALELKGDFPGAIAEFRRAHQLNGDPLSLAYLGNLYGKTGNIMEAANILTELEQLTKTKYVSAYAFALVQAGLGNRAEVLRWLEKCYADRSQEIGYLRVDRLLDPLRDDPGFQNLVGRVFSGKLE
jgi:serine/threonine protein kinase/Flp pilus assembly protein TadD